MHHRGFECFVDESVELLDGHAAEYIPLTREKLCAFAFSPSGRGVAKAFNSVSDGTHYGRLKIDGTVFIVALE